MNRDLLIQKLLFKLCTAIFRCFSCINCIVGISYLLQNENYLVLALCDPDIIHLIQIRAIGAHFFLRPIMSHATGYQLGKPLAQFFQRDD
jgi:hypothetical protein